MAPRVLHVVADAGAFIRNAPLREIAENVYTIPEVILESCDRATRRRLKLLPIDIKFKEPSGEALLIVTSFAKKTGDYLSLSSVDLKVLALTYDLEKQFKGTDHLRKDPPKKPQWNVGGQAQTTGLPHLTLASKQYREGEALPSSEIGEKADVDSDDDESGGDDDDEEEYSDALETLNNEINSVCLSETEKTSSDIVQGVTNHESCSGNILEKEDNGDIEDEEDDEASNEDDDDDDDDDGEGWITPANIAEVKKSMGIETTKTDVCVGCLTTDFAMQNVLIQMGLNVLSVDGLIIKRAKSYVLRCFGCMRITKDTTKAFCPHCGNKTLKRLSTTIDEDGGVKYWLAKNFTIRTRGTKFSLPRPQGGKHAINPVLCEDQPRPDQKPPKRSLQKIDILSADITADMSPFKINDVNSKAAQLGIRSQQPPQWAKRNPNESRKKASKRKGK